VAGEPCVGGVIGSSSRLGGAAEFVGSIEGVFQPRVARGELARVPPKKVACGEFKPCLEPLNSPVLLLNAGQ
jgi:hypothetical protein